MGSNPLNPHSKTLLPNLTNPIFQNMEKFQEVIFKLAEAHPNAALSPARKALLRDRLDRFVSQYKTPDHPPYSAMIERAIQELNEKRGSSEDSISQFLVKDYDNLPWAHSVLLKHHLKNLCESGDIVATRNKRYILAGEDLVLNSTTKVKKKKPTRRTKWRWDWEREKNRRRKRKLIKNGNQQRGRKKVVEKNQACDVKEQNLTENGVHCEDEQIKDDSSFLPTELQGITEKDKNKYSDEPKIGLSEITTAVISDERTHEQLEMQHIECSQLEISSPEKPPGFETIRVENLHNLEPAQQKPPSFYELFESERACRQLKRWSRTNPEAKAVSIISPKPEAYHLPILPDHSNLETPMDEKNRPESSPVNVDQMHHENEVHSVVNNTRFRGNEKYSRRWKTKLAQSETKPKIDSPKSSNQHAPRQQDEISQGKQLRRSLRHRPASKPEVNDNNNDCPEECPKTVCTNQIKPSKRKQVDEQPLEPMENSIKQRPDEGPPKRLRVRFTMNTMRSSDKCDNGTSDRSPDKQVIVALDQLKCHMGVPPKRRGRGRPAKHSAT